MQKTVFVVVLCAFVSAGTASAMSVQLSASPQGQVFVGTTLHNPLGHRLIGWNSVVSIPGEGVVRRGIQHGTRLRAAFRFSVGRLPKPTART